MLQKLCAEALDLTASEKGYRGALFAASADTPGGGGSLTLCCTVVLCSCLHLCW